MGILSVKKVAAVNLDELSRAEMSREVWRKTHSEREESEKKGTLLKG